MTGVSVICTNIIQAAIMCLHAGVCVCVCVCVCVHVHVGGLHGYLFDQATKS